MSPFLQKVQSFVEEPYQEAWSTSCLVEKMTQKLHGLAIYEY